MNTWSGRTITGGGFAVLGNALASGTTFGQVPDGMLMPWPTSDERSGGDAQADRR